MCHIAIFLGIKAAHHITKVTLDQRLPIELVSFLPLAGQRRPGSGPSLRVSSHPLPLTVAESLQLDTVLAVLAAVFILIPFCYLSGDSHSWLASAWLQATTVRQNTARYHLHIDMLQDHSQTPLTIVVF